MALLWFFFPAWVFLLAALYFYFIPLFHPSRLLFSFLLFLFLAFQGPQSIGFAVILGVLFSIILGIKDLILINRQSAYDGLVLALIFLLDIWFFVHFGDSGGYSATALVILLGAVAMLLYRESLAYSHEEWFLKEQVSRTHVALLVAWISISELALAALFLPVNFLYQSGILFFLSALLLALLTLSLQGSIRRERLLFYFSVAFVFLILFFGSISWQL